MVVAAVAVFPTAPPAAAQSAPAAPAAVAAVTGVSVVIEPFKNVNPTRPWQSAVDLGAGQTAPGFAMRGEKTTEAKLELPDSLNDWSGKTTLRLHLYNGGPAGSQMVILIKPLDNAAGSYWWTRLTADWQGWKDVELPLGASDVNAGIVASNKGTDKLLAAFGKVKELTFRNQWGAPAPGNESKIIATPSQSVWGLDRIEVK